MRFEHFDLNLLTVLDALLDERSVGGAARRLNVSQPAISNALRRLRDYFGGDPLLVAKGRRAALTPRAEQLASSVRHILNLVRAEVALPPKFDPATSERQFVVIASDFSISILLLPLLQHLARTAPKVRFRMQGMDEGVTEAFARGDVDLLIAPNQLASSEHPSELLFEDEFVVAAWSDNRSIGKRLNIERYFALGHVTAAFGERGMPAFDEWILKNANYQRRLEIFLPGFTQVAEALVGTERIATMHRSLAVKYAAQLPLKLWPVPIECPPLRQLAQYHALRVNDPGVKWLIGELRSVVNAGAQGTTGGRTKNKRSAARTGIALVKRLGTQP